MNDERFEERLRRTPLAEPGEGVRARLLRSGPTRRTRNGRWTWALAAAAAGLIAINLAFGQVHEARLAEIIGPRPAIQMQHSPAMWAAAMAERAQLMREIMGDEADFGGDEDEARTRPGTRTSRRYTPVAVV
jgi:hypothetical protein